MPIYVNDVEITDDEVNREMQHHPAGSAKEAQYLAAQALVIREILLQEAKKQSLLNVSLESISLEDEEEAITALLEKEVSVPPADRESCLRYYKQNSTYFHDKKTDKILPFEFVEEHIINYLQTRSMREGISQYIRLLAEQSKIAGFQLE